MTDKVLYLGDTALDAAASYLAGVMLHCNIPFDYIDSATKCTDKQLDQAVQDFSCLRLTVQAFLYSFQLHGAPCWQGSRSI